MLLLLNKISSKLLFKLLLTLLDTLSQNGVHKGYSV